ncbi:MAG: XrtA/PEP-CTERM system TPR-repeat protein PrsT [Cellvibrionaceae bacterium]
MARLLLSLVFFCISALSFAQKSPDEFYEDASRLFYAQEYPAAIIQLKNALQKNPEHVPSLVLTAETYIAQDRSAAAEETLIKARVLGADRRFINISLAEVYRRQGKYQSILDEISTRNLPPETAADILGYKSIAWLSLGKSTKAQDLIVESETIQPSTSFRTLIAKVLIAISHRDFDSAISLSEVLTERFQDRSESWNTYASALHASGQLQLARDAYTKAVNVSPMFVDARVSKSALDLDLDNLSEARGDLEFLKDKFPYEPRAAYLRALLYTKLNEEDSAKKSFDELKVCTEIIARLPQARVSADKQLPMVAAQAHYGLSEFESAKTYLSLYLKTNPQDAGANRLMGDILLKLNDPVGAIKFLRPAYQRQPHDSKAVSLLATAYSKAGHHEKATRLLERLRHQDSENSNLEDRLAITLLQAGHNDNGIAQLSSAFNKSIENTQSGFQLAIALLKSKRYTEALETAKTLVEQTPNNIAFKNLLGIAQHSAGHTAQARQSFENILIERPNSTSTVINLAKLEARSGNTNRAFSLLQEAIEQTPESSDTMLALAQLERDQGNIDVSLKLAEKARLIDLEDIDIRIFLMELYVIDKQYENAITLALDTNILAEHSFESTITLAKVYEKTGQPRKALAIYKQQSKKVGFHTERLHFLAQAMIKLNANSDARHALFKATESNPKHLPSHVSLISLLLITGEQNQALEHARELVQEHPKESISYLMLADSEVAVGSLAEASNTYSKGLEVGFMPELVLGLSHTLTTQGMHEKSLVTLEHYWKRHPAIGGAYSLQLIRENKLVAAKSALTRLIEADANDASHLNNMAYVLDELGSSEALGYAQRALRVSPENPYVNDTVGWLMVKAGNPEKGLKYLRQAAVRASNVPEIRYHLGKALLDLGRTVEAKRELKASVESGASFDGESDAKALLKSLG